jgi:mRNA-degrading endonuclease RelE of RelBE toxin-antitoxin system
MDDSAKIILDSIKEASDGLVSHVPFPLAEWQLEKIWAEPASRSDNVVLGSAPIHYSRGLEDVGASESRPRVEEPAKRPPPWYVGLSSNFKKDIDKIDMKIRGRILEAISNITEDPVRLHGDTVKPLSGELEGCWRYRVGDYRLIYSPNRATGDITLLAFAARGSAYD